MKYLKNVSVKQSLNKLRKKINESIYIKLIGWTSTCLIISCLIGFLISEVIKPIKIVNQIHVNYDIDRNDSDSDILVFIREVYENKGSEEEYITRRLPNFKGNTYITDASGKVVYRNDGNLSYFQQIDIKKFKENMKKENRDDKYDVIYPLIIKDSVFYIIQSKTLNAKVTYTKEWIYAISISAAFVLFILLMFIGVRNKIIYIKHISSALDKISKGDLNYEVEIKGEDELAQVAKEINNMEKTLLNKIEGERKIEKQKRELITNISHDLKTPLTIILGYLDIIRTNKFKSEKDRDNYIEITYNKAISLQKMVLRLFDLVKLGDKDIALFKRDANINKLIKQVALDYSPLAKEKDIVIDMMCPKESINLNVDLDKICRVFNNLMNNAIKYSPRNQVISIILENDEIGAKIIFKNKCSNLKEEDVKQLFDRFYRGDKARNSSIEGSGIGLSIVKNIVELHDSKIWAELINDEIYFILRLRG